MKVNAKTSLFIMASLTIACGKVDPLKPAEPVRGLKTMLIIHQENSSVRRYPSVLQPSESTELAFQVAGRLAEKTLSVGQKVSVGQILLSLDKRDLLLAVETAKAAYEETQASLNNTQSDLQRKEKLNAEGIISQTEIENVRTSVLTLQAQTEGAKSRLDTAREELTKSELKAPYDGIVNTVSVRSFNNITPGITVATLYNPNGFEAQFSVSYDIASRMVVGKPVTIRLADNPKVELKGHVSELATSTTTVSSYPVIVTLQDSHPALKVGMAVEISMEFSVTQGTGFTIPISAVLVEGSFNIEKDYDPFEPREVTVFLYDPDTQTAKKQQVSIGGIRDNQVIIVAGLKQGDRVAIAGVSFLREGQTVKLLSDNK
jgi:RND family efflux transporter MFP subunit